MLQEIPGYLKQHPAGNKYRILASESIAQLYGNPLFEGMEREGLDVTFEPYKDGEEVKRDAVAAELRRKLHRERFDRKSCLIIVSGGTLADLGGYVAGTFKRGCNYISIPTTFVGQTDAGIGGKTGVDDEHGKNMIGIFYNPRIVFNDPSLLISLPNSQISNGMGEPIKYGLMSRPDIFGYLEKSRDKVFSRNPEALEFIVHESAMTKVHVVEQDPRETKDVRTCLNLGHTTAHGIEAASRYETPHGIAVGLGLMVAAQLSVNRGMLDAADRSRLVALVDSYGLPIKLSQTGHDLTKEQIIAPMASDKKAISGVINFVLPDGIGSLRRNEKGGYSHPVEVREIEKALDVILS